MELQPDDSAVEFLGSWIDHELFVIDSDEDLVEDADDNCPHVPNSFQHDQGGWLTSSPDGIGDACQCGDLDGSGQMDENDVAELRLHLAGFLSELAPKTYQRCPAPTPTGECNIGDVVRLERAIAGLEPDVGQTCPAATQPVSP